MSPRCPSIMGRMRRGSAGDGRAGRRDQGFGPDRAAGSAAPAEPGGRSGEDPGATAARRRGRSELGWCRREHLRRRRRARGRARLAGLARDPRPSSGPRPWWSCTVVISSAAARRSSLTAPRKGDGGARRDQLAHGIRRCRLGRSRRSRGADTRSALRHQRPARGRQRDPRPHRCLPDLAMAADDAVARPEPLMIVERPVGRAMPWRPWCSGTAFGC